MAFTPILSDLSIDSIRNNTYYRNTARESAWGTPVFFVPRSYGINASGYGGAKYARGYTYDNSTSAYLGNCTWWCYGRLQETMGTSLNFIQDAKYWYDYYDGDKDTNANNINPGDIIVFTDSDAGHVMFVEKVSGNTIYISHSAYSTRSVWNGYACLTNNYQKSEITSGASINMYKNYGSAYYVQVVGVIHTGEAQPTPTPDTPTISIQPSSYSKIISASENYVDFPFTITISGIPTGYDASGGNTYPGLDRVYNTGWSYTSYTGDDGETYRRANKSQTLRYYREQNTAYNISKYMYFNITYPNGSINSTTPMNITVEKKSGGLLMLEWDGGGVAIR